MCARGLAVDATECRVVRHVDWHAIAPTSRLRSPVPQYLSRGTIPAIGSVVADVWSLLVFRYPSNPRATISPLPPPPLPMVHPGSDNTLGEACSLLSDLLDHPGAAPRALCITCEVRPAPPLCIPGPLSSYPRFTLAWRVILYPPMALRAVVCGWLFLLHSHPSSGSFAHCACACPCDYLLTI